MERRKDEFVAELDITTIQEMKGWGAKACAKWLTDWGNYIKSGGTRPPKPR